MTFGDFIFALGIDKPVKSLPEFEALAEKYLARRLQAAISILLPDGKEAREGSRTRSFHSTTKRKPSLRAISISSARHMPDDLRGKTILTNTVTLHNLDELRDRQVTRLVTTTPNLGGRSFGTNVMEAACSPCWASAGKTLPKTITASSVAFEFSTARARFRHARGHLVAGDCQVAHVGGDWKIAPCSSRMYSRRKEQ